MVDEQTRASFQPMIQERTIATTIVVTRFKMAPRVVPLTPARSLAPLERKDVSAPVELTSSSK